MPQRVCLEVSAVRNKAKPKSVRFPLQEMAKRLHNGNDFQYQVYWREADSKNTNWNSDSVKSPPFIVNNTGTFTPFEIKVQAVNAVGSGPAPKAETGHSGEDSMSPLLFFLSFSSLY